MHAHPKSIEDWMNDVRRGKVRLPRFQREETWTPILVSDFIEAVLLKRPLGIFLVLRVISNQQPFVTRPIAGAVNNGEVCTEHLLDGQQRLMSLWRSFKGTYENYAFYVEFTKNKNHSYEFKQVRNFAKIKKNLKWIGNPKLEFIEGYIPIPILEPGNGIASINWQREATDDEESLKHLAAFVGTLQTTMVATIIPYLAMPEETDPDQAIDTFIKSNTSSVRLNAFEIAVAQYEAAIPAARRKSSPSLRDLVDDIKRKLPKLARLEGQENIGDLAMMVACLKKGLKPTHGNYKKTIKTLEKDWNSLFKGLQWTEQFLWDEKIWDPRILPSTVPLRVLSALHPFIPNKGDDLAKAERLLRSYLWRSFVTDRYERSANSHLFEDFKVIKAALEAKTFTIKRRSHKQPKNIFELNLPDEEALIEEGWPTSKGILKRAILAVSTIKGARDVATHKNLSDQTVRIREHHHIFPDNLLKKMTKGEDPNRALNCMLLEAPTNNDWRDQWPGDYLMERVEKSKPNLKGERARKAVKDRLESHLIPSDAIMKAKKGTRTKVATAYQNFLEERAKLISGAFRKLCAGEDL